MKQLSLHFSLWWFKPAKCRAVLATLTTSSGLVWAGLSNASVVVRAMVRWGSYKSRQMPSCSKRGGHRGYGQNGGCDEQRSTKVQRRAMALATLLEPLLIVAMGGVVMLIVLAVLLPIIQRHQRVR